MSEPTKVATIRKIRIVRVAKAPCRIATVRKFRIVREEGSRQVARELEHYSLPAILAVGYLVRSERMRTRVWWGENFPRYREARGSYPEVPDNSRGWHSAPAPGERVLGETVKLSLTVRENGTTCKHHLQVHFQP